MLSGTALAAGSGLSVLRIPIARRSCRDVELRHILGGGVFDRGIVFNRRASGVRAHAVGVGVKQQNALQSWGTGGVGAGAPLKMRSIRAAKRLILRIAP